MLRKFLPVLFLKVFPLSTSSISMFIYLSFMCMHVYFCECMTCMFSCPWRSEEGLRPPGAGVTGSCGGRGARKQT